MITILLQVLLLSKHVPEILAMILVSDGFWAALTVFQSNGKNKVLSSTMAWSMSKIMYILEKFNTLVLARPAVSLCGAACLCLNGISTQTTTKS